MSLNAATLRRILNLGGDNALMLLAARFVEMRRDGAHELHCILSGFEAVQDQGGYYPALVGTLTELTTPKIKTPANDTCPRMSTSQKRQRFAELLERDGSQCSECGCHDRTIWRRMGCWSLPDGSRYTKVHPTSIFEVDHKTPLSEGGSNDLVNLWLLCVDCHKAKTSSERSARLKALFAETRR